MNSTQRQSILFAALAALFAAGCGTSAPTGQPPDGGTDVPAPSGLVGHRRALFHPLSGAETSAPIDMHDTFVQAVTQGTDGVFHYLPGEGRADGTFEIPDVAPGARWVRLYSTHYNQDQYVYTDALQMDLDQDVPGRMDAEAAGDGTLFFLDAVDGLSPWEDMDGIEAVSGNLGFGVTLFAWAEPGADTVTTSLDWRGFPRFSAAKGDDLLLVQTRHFVDAQSNLGYTAPVASLALADAEMHDGEVLDLKGTFSTPPVLDYHLVWKRSEFAALKSQIHPTLAKDPVDQRFRASAMPGGSRHGILLHVLPLLLELDWDAFSQGTEDFDHTFTLRNPYPADWLVSEFAMAFPLEYAVPGAPNGAIVTAYASVGVATRALPDAAHPVVPRVSPVRALKVGGKDATAEQAGVGLTPTVSWAAPAQGSPTGYAVTVYRWEGLDEGFGALNERAVLMVPGDVHEVVLPPTVLQAGGRYVIDVRAISQAGQDVRVQGLYRSGLPYAWADAMTSTFAP